MSPDLMDEGELFFYHTIEIKKQDRAANSQYKAHGIEACNFSKPQEGTDISAHKSPGYSDKNGNYKPSGILARHNELRQGSHYQPHDYPGKKAHDLPP